MWVFQGKNLQNLHFFVHAFLHVFFFDALLLTTKDSNLTPTGDTMIKMVNKASQWSSWIVIFTTCWHIQTPTVLQIIQWSHFSHTMPITITVWWFLFRNSDWQRDWLTNGHNVYNPVTPSIVLYMHYEKFRRACCAHVQRSIVSGIMDFRFTHLFSAK